ncbi:MAG: hypothetical protein HY902_05185 [Deltaproteobacteria bacterium]|nr:hypothetical protein [Deltaproteobacteria bacterium]
MILAVPIWRRGAAVAALLACIGLAYMAAIKRPGELQVSWLLTHVEAQRGALQVGRERLVELHWSVADAPGSAKVAAAGSLHFQPGTAPEVAGPTSVAMPAGVSRIEVRCRFALAGGAELRTLGGVELTAPAANGRITLDIDRCGAAQ